MPIQFITPPAVPQEVQEVLKRTVNSVSSEDENGASDTSGIPSHAAAVGLSSQMLLQTKAGQQDDSGYSAPHRIFSMRVDDLADGSGLERASAEGWRYLKENSPTSMEIYVRQNESGDGKFGELTTGPYSQGTRQALKEAEADPELTEGIFEPRLLQIPGLQTLLLWAHNEIDHKDIFVPISPAPKFLDSTKIYTADELFPKLREAAKFLMSLDLRP